MNNMTKVVHDAHQKSVNQFMKSTSNSMIDFMVARAISSGHTDLSKISKILKCQKEKLISSITTSLFKIDGDTINLA